MVIEGKNVLTNLIVTNILQYIYVCVSNHHIAYLKLIQRCQLHLSKAEKYMYFL